MKARSWENWLENTFLGFLLLVVAVWVIFPIFWAAIGSLKSQLDSVASPPLFVPFLQYKVDPVGWIDVFSYQGRAIRAAANSFIIAVSSAVLSVLIGSLAAYSLARFEFKRWKNDDIAFWILSNRIFPAAVLVVPYFILFRTLNMLDTLPAVIIADTAANLPFVVWMLRGFFSELPKEIEESAAVDGASPLSVFIRIVLPVSLPSIAVAWIFSFIFAWNELLFGLALTLEKSQPLTVTMSGFLSQRGMDWWAISALSILSIGPPLVLSLAIQRYIVRGLTFGAVKG